MTMNKRITLASSTLLLAGLLAAQGQGPNLVKNPGFDETNAEVTTWDQLDHATGWTNANNGTADVFATTGSTRSTGQPDNALGNAAPVDGGMYAGFVAFKDQQRNNWRRVLDGNDEAPFKSGWNGYSEYLQAELSSPLQAGKKYEISFRVSLAEESDRAVSGIGAYCSPAMIAEHHNHHLDVKPQVFSAQPITDKAGWVEVKGEFVAEGSEQYIIIGAFPAAGMEATRVVEGPDNQRAYYFVDGISLMFAPEPDADGDGVPDKVDNCPNEAGSAELGGCPDRDGDGVVDKMDGCPDLAGPADKQGCPDSDGDGVADNVDRCPDVPGVASMRGCPELKEETKKLFEKALTGIQFESGKSVIKKSSYGILDDVADVMKNNAAYNLEIHGHTDSQGDDAMNMKLSEDRAAAVKKYLEDKGVEDARIKSFGHGEEMPIADNGTSAGRAKNRRVEFKVEFWE